MQNPLFPTSPQDSSALQQAGAAPHHHAAGQASAPAEPSLPPDDEASRQAAADLIRRKVAAAYGEEPDAEKEIGQIEYAQETARTLSKHQAYMQSLQQSGKSLVEIQSAWHDYYANLSNTEKHEVWREFYTSQSSGTPLQQELHKQHQAQKPAEPAVQYEAPVIKKSYPVAPAATSVTTYKPARQETPEKIKARIHDKVSAGTKPGRKNHLQSLAFGLASGLVVVFIFLFSFFNEVILAPFIQPSRHASETPVIVDPASAAVGTTPKVIIPKINVEIPVDYTQTTIDDKAIEAALDNGIVHYPTTVKPGEAGNSVFFGHSSNNIFNPGKYKFAFVLLHELRDGDTFYLTREGKAYAYKVVQRRVVEPTEISVLGPVAGYAATATLITCDPPGTSLKRLVVVGEQISPTPPAPTDTPQPQQPAQIISATGQTSLPGNGPTLWGRLWGSIF